LRSGHKQGKKGKTPNGDPRQSQKTYGATEHLHHKPAKTLLVAAPREFLSPW
jgi:hypothetical protein